ncbi:MAG TPA: IclR family transcriptional regulator [Pseudonocardia sp.]|nr:IclR family transcriptional regulator [Pseudonocardia sp.]
MKNKPAYSIESVDHALRLAVLLRQEGPLRVAEVAERLEVARSTAHRLLAMLVYRDFAEQGPDRRYQAGPAMRGSSDGEPVAQLRTIALPHLRELVDRVGETANLMVLRGDQARFVATVECDAVLRVGDREGRMLPAHLASGGRALLAHRTDAEVDALYAGGDVDLEALRRGLRLIRKQGFAVNNQGTEAGVTAVGRAIFRAPGTAVGALSLAMPTARYKRARLPEWAGELARSATLIEHDLAALAHD